MGHPPSILSAAFPLLLEMARPPSDGLKAVVYFMQKEPGKSWNLRDLYAIYQQYGGLGSYNNFQTVLGRLTAGARPDWELGPRHPVAVSVPSRKGGGRKEVRWGLPPGTEADPRYLGFDPGNAPPPRYADPSAASPKSEPGGFQQRPAARFQPSTGASDFELPDDDDFGLGPAGAGSPPPPKPKPAGPPPLSKAAPAVAKAAGSTQAPAPAEKGGDAFGDITDDDPAPSMAEIELDDAIGEQKSMHFREAIENAVEHGHEEKIEQIVRKMVPQEHWRVAWVMAQGIVEEFSGDE